MPRSPVPMQHHAPGQRLLILSVDYEVFGNGTGDVRQHVVDPTERMARLCEKHGMPLSIFVEVEECLAFARFAKELRQALGYDPAQSIHQQLVALLQRGHEAQLHLHPQWHDARYEAGKWRLRTELQTVDDLFGTQAEVTEYIRERKAVLDSMIAEAKSSQMVSAYRAGAFCAQPGVKLLVALEANRILLDSSVVKGLTRQTHQLGLDYRTAPCAKGPWPVARDVAQEDANGKVWEFPIYSVMRRRIHQLTVGRLRAKFSGNVPKDRQREMMSQLGLGRNPLHWLRFLWQPVPIKLDFHNVSPRKLLKWIKSAPAPEDGLPDVVVLIGHTKEHVNDRSFDELLHGIAADASLKVITFDTLARLMVPQARAPSG